jgi:hypothetical protein
MYAGVAATRAIFLRETLHRAKQSLGSERNAQTEDVSAEKQEASKYKTLSSNLNLVLSNRVLLALTLAYTVYGVLFDQPSFVVTLYSVHSLHLSTFQLGLMYSMFLVVDTQLAIPFGKMADR